MSAPRTKIEIVEPMDDPENGMLLRTQEVRINGIPVLVAHDGIEIENASNGEILKVTLELLPDELSFRRASKYKKRRKN